MIQHRVEPYFHVVGILSIMMSIVYLILTQSFGPGGTICWIASNPSSTSSDTAQKLYVKRWIFIGGPVLVFFVGVCVNMFLIYRTAETQENTANKYRFSVIKRESNIFEADSSSGDGRRFSLASISSSMTIPSRTSCSSRQSKKNQVIIFIINSL